MTGTPTLTAVRQAGWLYRHLAGSYADPGAAPASGPYVMKVRVRLNNQRWWQHYKPESAPADISASTARIVTP